MVHVDGFQMICLHSCCTSILSGIETLPSCHWRWWLTPASIPRLFRNKGHSHWYCCIHSVLNLTTQSQECKSRVCKWIGEKYSPNMKMMGGNNIVWPSNENPASDNKSIAFCFSGSTSPYMMSRAAALYPWCFTHLVTQASPAKSSMKSYFSGGHRGSQEMVSRIYFPFLSKKYLWNKQVWQ